MKEKDKLSKERDDQLQEITQVWNIISKIFCCHVTWTLKLRNTVKETIELQKAAETQRDEAEATMLEVMLNTFYIWIDNYSIHAHSFVKKLQWNLKKWKEKQGERQSLKKNCKLQKLSWKWSHLKWSRSSTNYNKLRKITAGQNNNWRKPEWVPVYFSISVALCNNYVCL